MSDRNIARNKPIALVIGFNIHGLAIARSLAKGNVEVHALTASLTLPAVHTRYANVYQESGINTDSLVESLHRFAKKQLVNRKAVLFPTSDTMVRIIATNWSTLSDKFILSWSSSLEQVVHLQSKANLPEYCSRSNVPHPATADIRGIPDCENAVQKISFPLVVKPAKPLSGFKALILNTRSELVNTVETFQSDLPFVAQQYIDGSPDDLFFCTMFLISGAVMCSFTGRKLKAIPPTTGQGTVMTGESCTEIIELSQNFLAGLNLTGPVAIEFKRDANGKFWLIEPNVGRTEYCVDLLIQSGKNLPLIEYFFAVGLPIETEPESNDRKITWYDTDKDFLCYFRHCFSTRSLHPLGHTPIFPYIGARDCRPASYALLKIVRDILKSIMRKLLQLARSLIGSPN